MSFCVPPRAKSFSRMPRPPHNARSLRSGSHSHPSPLQNPRPASVEGAWVGASNNDHAEGLHTLEAVALELSDAGPRLRWLQQLAAWMLHGCSSWLRGCCMDAAGGDVCLSVCPASSVRPSSSMQHGRSRLWKTGPAMYSAEVLS